MAWLDEFRKNNAWTKDYTDREIISYRAQQFGMAPEEFAAGAGIKSNEGTMGDLGTRLKHGLQKIPGGVVGLGDVAAGLLGDADRPFSRAADWAGEKTGFQPGTWAKQDDARFSPGHYTAQQEVNQAWADPNAGAWDVAKAYATNPGYTLGQVVESAPSIALGGVYGRGLRALSAGRIGGVAAGAAGEGFVGAGQAMAEIDPSVDPRRAATAALASGVGTSLLGYAGGRLTKRAGLVDVDTAMAGGAGVGTSPMAFGRRVAGGALAEGVIEEAPQSIQEQMWQNWAHGNPLSEGVARAGVEGALAGGLMGAGFNVMPGRTRQQLDAGQPADLLGTPPAGPTPLLEHNSSLQMGRQLVSYPDGSVGFADDPEAWNMKNALAMPEAPPVPDESATEVENFNFNQRALPTPVDVGSAIAALRQLGSAPIIEGSPEHQVVLQAGRILEQAGVNYGRQAPQVAPAGSPAERVDLAGSPGNLAAIESLGRGAGGPAAAPALSSGTNSPVGVADVANPTLTIDGARSRKALMTVLDAQLAAGEILPEQHADAANLIVGSKKSLQVIKQKVAQALTPPEARVAQTGDEITALIAGMPKRQQEVAAHVLQALRENRADEVIDSEGGFKVTEIGNALGLAKGSVKMATNGLMKTVAKSMGMTVEEAQAALRARTAEVRTTQLADQDALGMSPALQGSEVELGDALGENQSMGVINSVGGSQSEIGENEYAPDNGPTELDLEIEARNKARAAAEAEAAFDFLLALPEANNAAADWDDFKSDGAPGFASLVRAAQAAWVETYSTVVSNDDSLAAIEAAQRDFERALEVGDVRTEEGAQRGANPAVGVRGSTESFPAPIQEARGQAEDQARLESQQGQVSGEGQSNLAEESAAGADARQRSPQGVSLRGAPTNSQTAMASPDAETSVASDDRTDGGQARTQEPGIAGARENDGAAGETLTPQDIAEAWNEAAEANNLPTFGMLHSDEREELLTATDENHLNELANALAHSLIQDGVDGPQYSETSTTTGNTVEAVIAAIKSKFAATHGFNRLVKVFATTAEAKAAGALSQDYNGKAQGFVKDGKVYLIAENIHLGREMAVFLHELGVHIGLEKLLGAKNMQALHNQVQDWAKRNDGSQESKLAKAAVARAEKSSSENQQAEVVAYFVEEAVNAGVEPKLAANPVARWLANFQRWAEATIRDLLGKPYKMTARDLVQMAYGAAQMELVSAHEALTPEQQAAAKKGAKHTAAELLKMYAKDDAFFRYGRPDFLDFTRGFDMQSLFNEVEPGWKVRSIAASPGMEGGPTQAWEIKNPDGYIATAYANAEGKLWVNAVGFESGKGSGTALYAGLQSFAGENGKVFTGDPLGVSDEAIVRRTENMLSAALKQGTTEHMQAAQEQQSPMRYSGTGEHNTAFLEKLTPVKWGTDPVENLANLVHTSYKNIEALVPAIKEFSYDHATGEFYRNGHPVSDADIESVLRDAKKELEAVGGLPSKSGALPIGSNSFKRAVIVAPAYREGDSGGRARVLSSTAGKLQAVRVKDTQVAKTAYSEASTNSVAFTTGQKLMADLPAAIANGANHLAFLHDLVDAAKGTLKSAKDWYDKMQAVEHARHEVERAAEAVADKAAKLSNEQLARVNKFLAESTLKEKWAYQPQWLKRKVVVDPGFAQQWGRLSQQERDVIDGVFKQGEDTLQKKRALAKEIGGDEALNRFNNMEGPYAPLKRFGNYVVVAKSAELEKAQEDGDEKLIEKLKADPKHYFVAFRDTNGQAQELRAQVEKQFSGVAYATPRLQFFEENQELAFKQVARLRAAVGADEKLGQKGELNRLLTELYLTSLAEHHARQSQQKRTGVQGFDEDMIRAFLTQGRADASFLSYMEHGAELNDLMYRMQREARGNYQAVQHFNIIGEHYAKLMDIRPTPWQDKAMVLASVYQLLSSPAYYLTNLTQPWLLSLPVLAGKFGYAKSFSALRKAYAATQRGDFDPTRHQNADERKFLEEAQLLGVLDIGLDADMGRFDSTRTGYAAVDKASELARKTTYLLRQLARKVETVNRVASGLATYRLARESGMSHADAAEYGVSVLRRTQGDYSGVAAPLLLKKIPKVMGQYRKFQLMQIGILARVAKASFFDANLDPMERAVARRQLAWIMAHTAAAGGVLGLPAMNLVGLLFAAMGGDDDEPADLERSMREAIGDQFMADLILKGVPAAAGMDLSGRLAMTNTFGLLPYSRGSLDSQKGAKELVADAIGPAAGVGYRLVDGLNLMRGGDYVKGVEKLLPNGVANAIQGMRQAQEGVTMRNGDLVTPAEDYDFFAAFARSIGLPLQQETRRQWIQGQLIEAEEALKARTAELKKEYTKAFKSGEDTAEIREAWMNLQQTKRRLGFKPAPLSDLLKAPTAQRKREAETVAGVQARSTSRKFVEQTAAL